MMQKYSDLTQILYKHGKIDSFSKEIIDAGVLNAIKNSIEINYGMPCFLHFRQFV